MKDGSQRFVIEENMGSGIDRLHCQTDILSVAAVPPLEAEFGTA